MRLQDVKVGDVVTLKEWSGTIRLNGGSYLEWSAAYAGFVNKVFRIDLVDRDGSVRLAFPDGSYLWWPVAYCAPPAHQNPFKLGDYAVAPSGVADLVVGLSDTTVLLQSLGWYPTEVLRPSEFKRRAAAKQGSQQSLDAAGEALGRPLPNQLETELADERRTVADLRKTVADLTQLTTSLESQVVALRSELQIEDVKVGDVVEIMTKTGRYQDQDTVVEIEAISDGSCEPYIRLQHGGWWEPSRLRLLRRPPLTVGTDTAQLSTERLAATEAIRYAQQLERTLAEVKSEAETKIKSLESQVVALRAEVQKVGKQLQHGSRFALLELD